MASIDKIYGKLKQYEELRDWLNEHKPEALDYLYFDSWNGDEWMYDDKEHPISCFPEHVDMWLLKNCPLSWVVERIKDQYGLLPENASQQVVAVDALQPDLQQSSAGGVEHKS